MKGYLFSKYLQFKVTFFIFNIFICLSYLSSSLAISTPNGKYTFDQDASQMNFHVKNFGLLTVNGKFVKFSGTIHFITPFEQSQVESSSDIISIDTNISSRNKHLLSDDFFDQEKFPTMTFKSSQVIGTINSFKLIGDLMIKGIKKSVTFVVTGNIDEKNKDEYNFQAITTINRNDFDITHGSTVSNNVTIELEIHAIKAKSSL